MTNHTKFWQLKKILSKYFVSVSWKIVNNCIPNLINLINSTFFKIMHLVYIVETWNLPSYRQNGSCTFFYCTLKSETSRNLILWTIFSVLSCTARWERSTSSPSLCPTVQGPQKLQQSEHRISLIQMAGLGKVLCRIFQCNWILVFGRGSTNLSPVLFHDTCS